MMSARPSFQMYYGQLERLVTERLNSETRDYLASVDRDAYLDHLVAEFEWQPLEWHEDGKSVEPVTRKVQRRDDFDGRSYTAEVDRIRLRVPLSPHPRRVEYFKYDPSIMWVGSPEPKWELEGDILIHEVDASEQGVNRGIEDIKFWLGNRNKDIESENRTLRARIAAVLDARVSDARGKQSATEALLAQLNIPLHRDPSAKAQPIEIKQRTLRVAHPRPSPRKTAVEPELKPDDLIALVDFIELYSRQFETAPEDYAQLGEEGIRNLLVGMLNANFRGAATGETFSKLGKTDVLLRVDAGNVLVTECKMWSGAAAYTEAIDQLFGYVTWRHGFGVLLHFSRVKNLSRAVGEAKRATREHSSFAGVLTDANNTRFWSRHAHPQDTEKRIEIHHLFVDLAV